MTPLAQLKSILTEKYVTEDGEDYQVELKPGLTDDQIDVISRALPNGTMPGEVRELLQFSGGFTFYGLEEVTFDGVGEFGFDEMFPASVQLAGDGYGNFWIVDVQMNGDWGNVFYVCHDPAVVVKHSENIAEFIRHVDEYGKKGEDSNLGQIHDDVSNGIWYKNNGLIEKSVALQTADEELKSFASSLPDNFFIADLRNKPIQSGFAWGKFSPRPRIVRHKTKLIWAFEKKEKKSLFSKLFGG